jgi:uncharacterized iron-regulated membrane protein
MTTLIIILGAVIAYLAAMRWFIRRAVAAGTVRPRPLEVGLWALLIVPAVALAAIMALLGALVLVVAGVRPEPEPEPEPAAKGDAL